jgi:hypothetical protein
MKIYIVTSGMYEGYSIEKVFLNREKAEKYAQLYPTDIWGDKTTKVEEYETFDDEM